MPATIDRPRFTKVHRSIEPNRTVWCPRLERHVELERCFDCEWQERVSNGPPRPFVVCGAPRP